MRLPFVSAKRFDAIQSRISELENQLATASIRSRMKPTASGVPMTYGGFDYEQTTALQGTEKWDTLDKMETDPHVKGSLRTSTLPLLTAEWTVQPASDSAKDQDVAEFVAAVLLRQPSDKYGPDYWTKTSWKGQRLPEILDMLRAGFALFAKSTRVVNGKVIYDRLQWLEPESVDPRGWDLDDQDQVVAVKRTYRDPMGGYKLQDPIQAGQLSLYVWDLRGARLEGRPFIRSMYGAWFRKDFIQRQAAIWAQKVGAPVPYGSYPDGWTPKEIADFQMFLQTLRGTSPAVAWGMFKQSPDGKSAEVKFAGAETGEVDRMRGLIDGENAEIAHAGGTKSQLLGETSSGSRALGQSQGAVESQMVQAIAEIVCEFENHGVANLPGLVEELCGWNFGGLKAFPRLAVSKMQPYEGIQNIEVLVKAKQAGLVPDCPELRQQVTAIFGFNLPDDVYEQEPVVPTAPKVGPDGKPVDPEAEPGDEDDDEDEEAVAASLEAFRDRIAGLLLPAQEGAPSGAGFRRPPNQLEARYCNLAEVSETFRVGERDAMTAIREIRYRMTEEILGRVRSGKFSPRNLDGQRRSKFRGFEKAKGQLLGVLRSVGEEGMAHVKAEIAKQGGR